MRKVIRALISAALTFTIGILVALVWSHLFLSQVSLCTLAHNPKAYDRKMIRVEALGSVVSSPIFSEKYIIIAEPGCSEPDGWASVQLDGSLKLSPEVDEFVNSPRQEIREANVVVEGQFDQRASLGCFSPRFGIKAARVKLISSVTTEVLPERSHNSR